MGNAIVEEATINLKDRGGPPWGSVDGVSGGNDALGYVGTGFSNGDTITINTDGTNDFGAKTNAKPLLYWDAEDGVLPNTDIGRTAAWGNTFDGEASSAITYDYLSQSYRLDHETEGLALGIVDFTGTELYVHRQKYEDFDIVQDMAIRTRFTTLVGTLEIGQTVTGGTSGATGIIISFNDSGSPFDIFYNNVDGTVNDPTPTDFVFGENMSTPTATMVNSEGGGSGTLRTFNFKTFRMFPAGGGFNNSHVNTNGSFVDTDFKITPENTGSTLNPSSMAVQPVMRPYEWLAEEIIYKAGTIDTKDGTFDYIRNGQQFYLDKFIQRTTTYPDLYGDIRQSQVSSGAQPNSFAYYASLYVDDSLARVVVHDEPTLTIGTTDASDDYIQPLPPSAWADDEITVRVVGSIAGKYFSIFDTSGAVVVTGQFV